MKNILLFAGAAVLLAGCCGSSYETGGVGSYGYTYDLNLPYMTGSPAALQALNTIPCSTVAEASASQFTGPASTSQSVVFYEGAQGAQAGQAAVASGTPVWTAPAPVTSVPGAVPGAPIVNEAAGAATGVPVAGGTVAPGVGEAGVAPTVVLGDGGGGFVGTNGAFLSTNPGVVINNTNSVILTNGTGMNVTNTNGIPMTNSFGGITNSNGSIAITNFSGGPTNFAFTNGTATPQNGTPAAPVAGATNNLNNLPRAAGPTIGEPAGTSLVPARPLGQPPTVSQSQAISGTTTTPNTPTQPGPSTSTTGSTPQTGNGTGTQTVIGGQVPNTVPIGTSTTPQTGTGTTVVTPGTSAAQQRMLLNQRAAQQQAAQRQGTQTTTQGTQAAPAPAPAPNK